ncbi:MAG: hypothetical protein ACK5PP_12870 [Acidimicrobiales bacterium]
MARRSSRSKPPTPAKVQPITPGDIEAQLRRLQHDTETTVGDTRKKLAVAAAVVGVLTLGLIFFLGQRSGRRKATVVEIRRI